MKSFIVVLLMSVFLATCSYTQTPSTAPSGQTNGVITQEALNKVHTVWGIKTDSVAKTTIKYLIGISVQMPIAADTITIRQATTASGGDTLAWILVPATASNPFYIPVGKKIDSTYVITKIYKTSRVFLHYRNVAY